MSIKINWEAIKLSQYDGLSYLQSHLSTLSLPDAINSIDITSLDLGSSPPVVEIISIGTPTIDTLSGTDDDDDESIDQLDTKANASAKILKYVTQSPYAAHTRALRRNRALKLRRSVKQYATDLFNKLKTAPRLSDIDVNSSIGSLSFVSAPDVVSRFAGDGGDGSVSTSGYEHGSASIANYSSSPNIRCRHIHSKLNISFTKWRQRLHAHIRTHGDGGDDNESALRAALRYRKMKPNNSNNLGSLSVLFESIDPSILDQDIQCCLSLVYDGDAHVSLSCTVQQSFLGTGKVMMPVDVEVSRIVINALVYIIIDKRGLYITITPVREGAEVVTMMLTARMGHHQDYVLTDMQAPERLVLQMLKEMVTKSLVYPNFKRIGISKKLDDFMNNIMAQLT